MASLSEMETIFTLTFAFKGSVILLLITKKTHRVRVGEHRLKLLEGRFLVVSQTYGYLCTSLSFSNFFSPLIGVQFRLVKIGICICLFDQPSMRTSKPCWPLPHVGRSTESAATRFHTSPSPSHACCLYLLSRLVFCGEFYGRARCTGCHIKVTSLAKCTLFYWVCVCSDSEYFISPRGWIVSAA